LAGNLLEAAEKHVIVGLHPTLPIVIPNQGVVVDLASQDEIAQMSAISNVLFSTFAVDETEQRLPQSHTQSIRQLSHPQSLTQSIPLKNRELFQPNDGENYRFQSGEEQIAGVRQENE
jgi:hypothetical protein